MAFDPLLYLALLVGVVAGRFLPHPSAWISRATLGTVAALVALLGASLSSVAPLALAVTIPIALGFTLLLLASTAAVYLLVARRATPHAFLPPPPVRTERFPISVGLLGALVVGFAAGHLISFPASAALTYALYVLLALVGFELPLRWKGLHELWVPVTAAAIGGLVSAGLFALVARIPLSAALATSLAFGWYSLSGPLVADRLGAVLGLLAFLTNFLRENLTMLLAPSLGRRLRGGGLTALGGATAMDTTLYFITRYGDPESGTLALASGLVLTVAASLILPAVLAVPL